MTEDSETLDHCVYCGGDLQLMGTLGRLEHFRCRACGMWFNQEKENVRADSEG